jgi:uncharacterized protein (TIGR02246 family)
MNQNSQTVSSAGADEAAIRGLYQQVIDGWNASSGDAFAAPFEEDSDLVGFDGTHLRFKKRVENLHKNQKRG